MEETWTLSVNAFKSHVISNSMENVVGFKSKEILFSLSLRTPRIVLPILLELKQRTL